MKSVLSPIAPQNFKSVGGFLGQRFHANRMARLNDPVLAEEFVRLHERKTFNLMGREQSYDDWFWLGEQVGKWLDAAEGLLGPALRVRGSIQTRAPIFATTQGNAKLPMQEEKDFVLLPFANQGAVQGEYGVFLRYR